MIRTVSFGVSVKEHRERNIEILYLGELLWDEKELSPENVER